MSLEKIFIFDFDSTFVRVEALEELAEISLKKRKGKKEILKRIEEITNLGIEGDISFTDSLNQRLDMIKARKKHLKKLIDRLGKKISPSIKRNKKFFKKHSKQIYIISAGFKDFIIPIAKKYHIPAERVFANSFEFDKKGNISGFDKKNPLSWSGGKEEQLNALSLKGDIIVIGDGYSDFRMKKYGDANKFFAFTENVERDSAISSADHVTPNLDEFLYKENLPMEISYPKNRIKVLLLENIHSDAAAIFREEGYQVETVDRGLTEDELCKAIKDVQIIGIRSKSNITKRVLKHANRLKVVGAFCIGTNQIDLDACLEKGVIVFNAPYSNTRSVVELVLGEMIMLIRGIPDKNRLMHESKWNKSAKNSNEIRGKTLGIVGYGNIGAQLSVIAEALGMKVCYYDKVDKLALGNAVKCNSLKEMLKISDFVSLHVDGDPINKDFFGDKEFKMMKKGSFFLNLARGFVVDIPALAKYINSGRILGAAVDVFPVEPKSNAEPFVSELRELPNVILTPHIGGSTMEAQENIASFVPDKIIGYINSGSSFNSVNFPNLQLPEFRKSHRLIHIHRNVPGILAKINNVLAAHEINIVGQYLKTNEIVGYVITDISEKYDPEVIEALKNIDHTVSVRVLY